MSLWFASNNADIQPRIRKRTYNNYNTNRSNIFSSNIIENKTSYNHTSDNNEQSISGKRIYKNINNESNKSADMIYAGKRIAKPVTKSDMLVGLKQQLREKELEKQRNRQLDIERAERLRKQTLNAIEKEKNANIERKRRQQQTLYNDLSNQLSQKQKFNLDLPNFNDENDSLTKWHKKKQKEYAHYHAAKIADKMRINGNTYEDPILLMMDKRRKLEFQRTGRNMPNTSRNIRRKKNVSHNKLNKHMIANELKKQMTERKYREDEDRRFQLQPFIDPFLEKAAIKDNHSPRRNKRAVARLHGRDYDKAVKDTLALQIVERERKQREAKMLDKEYAMRAAKRAEKEVEYERKIALQRKKAEREYIHQLDAQIESRRFKDFR